MDPLIGAGLISGASSILGGIARSITGSNSQAREYARQKEFAQNGISWRVADAERAGIHPLAAIGANVTSYTPQSVYGDDYGLSDMGQSLSNFIQKYKSPKERAHDKWLENTNNALSITRQQLENERLRSEIAQNNAETSRIVLENQPGNPKPLANGYQTESRLMPKSGPIQRGDALFEWNETETPGVFRLSPTSEYASKYEDKMIIEFAPFADSWRAGGFHGKSLQGMIYSKLHHGWIRDDGDLAIDLRNFLIENAERKRRKSQEILERH